MKKIAISSIFIVLLLFSGIIVNAQEFEIGYAQSELPKTNAVSSVSVFSDYNLENALVEGWNDLAQEVDVSAFNLNVSNIADTYFNIIYSNPRLYYVKTSLRYSYNSYTGKISKVYPDYTETDIHQIQTMLSEIDKETENIISQVNNNMSDFQKVMTVHDYMVLNYKYDTTYSNYNTSMMVTKTGVCQAYALIFKLIMDELGIECTYVSSDEMNHAWNLVKVDGEWYHIDVTWDDPISDRFGVVSHIYALLSSEQIEALSSPHYGFDLGLAEADSDIYDNADWHNTQSSIVSYASKSYYVLDNDIVSSQGDVIYSNIAGNDGRWNISQNSVLSQMYAGLSVYNGKLYFNTDTAIYVYDFNTQKTEVFSDIKYVCGLYTNQNTLYYAYYKSGFVKGGEIKLDSARIGEPYYDGNQVTVKMYVDEGARVDIFSQTENDVHIKQITESGVSECIMDAGAGCRIYFWDENMAPYVPQLII